MPYSPFNQCQKLYNQGQFIGKLREYFYYINHEGMLFLDDARMKNFTSAYKDIDFLTLFYKNLHLNETNRYKESFPFFSLCARERNYLRCEDRPIVFTEVQHNEFRIGGSKITVPLEPDSLSMLSNGRLYHPSPFAGFGLVKSSLADQLFPLFKFDSIGYPTSFHWGGQWFELSNNIRRSTEGF